jgi:flagellar FliL protein
MAKAASDAEASAPKSKMPIFMAIGIVVAFAAAFLVAKQMMAKPSKQPEKPEVGTHVVLDEFLINLADPTNDRYLKTTIALGLKKGVTDEQFKEKIPPARDAIVMCLSAKKLADVRSPEGKMKIKEEIKADVNKAIGGSDVVEVDYQTFATQ